MTETPESPSRVRRRKPAPTHKRNLLTALGGLFGALAMSVIAGVLIAAAVTPAVALSGTAAGAAVDLFENLPNHIDPGTQAEPSVIYATDADGNRKEIASFYTQNRVEKGWGEINQYVKDAAVAVEDPGFYTHGGVNVVSAARAAVQNLVAGDGPGASTITMQYVRNVLIQESYNIMDEEESAQAYQEAMEVSIDRKLKEMRLAISLEKKFTKDEILLGYLNIALFGGQVYGIESAAQYFYGKSANDVSIAEAASLIAIVNAPQAYRIDSEDNLERNQDRRDYILDRMLFHGKITEAQHEEAIATPVEPNITPRQSGCSAVTDIGLGHFCNYVKLYIENDPTFGNDPAERYFNLSRGGFEIDTTIDLELQAASYEAFQENIPAQYDGFDAGGAAVTVEVGTGRVLQMNQNRQFHEDQAVIEENPDLTAINFNTDFEYGGSEGFQIGSTIKPFNLANWLKQGRSLNETVRGNGYEWNYSSIPANCMPGGVYQQSGGWRTKNHNNLQYGNRNVLYAMAYSINASFINMTQKTDMCDIMALAEDMGLHHAKAEGPEDDRSLDRVPVATYAGTDYIAPITMAAAYAGFSGQGVVCTPIPIDKIFDREGTEVSFTQNECNQAIDPAIAAGVAYALEYNVKNGIGGHARSYSGVPHFAKTGTTDDYWDHWTVGGSTEVATALWTGNVLGKVNTEYSGLPYDGDRVFGMILNAADGIYGGQAFDRPDESAFKVKTKAVPNTAGKTVAETRNMLETLGFEVTEAGERDSSVTAGLVAGTDPEGGGQAPEGSTIAIYVSNGQMSEVPANLVGRSADDARSALQRAGFSNISVTCEGGGNASGSSQVASVNPSGGSEANQDSQITLRVVCETPDDDDDDRGNDDGGNNGRGNGRGD